MDQWGAVISASHMRTKTAEKIKTAFFRCIVNRYGKACRAAKKMIKMKTVC
jgi:hypothetical protein